MNEQLQALAKLGWTWSNVDPAAHFAGDYGEARAKFLAAAARREIAVESHVHPQARGPSGEPLAVDVAVLGNRDAPAALMITSGAHGAEGFCGSGCQVALLADDAFVATARQRGVAVVMVHALNPYGFAHITRTTEDNVDLNRNFRDFAQPLANPEYAAVHEFIVPATWPPSQENEARLFEYVARRGAPAMQAVITRGQSERADGLFYAGKQPTWSHAVLRDILRRQGARSRLAWIDLHTGLGPLGHGEKIFAGLDNAADLARVRAFWGADVTSIWDGSSTSAKLEGMLFVAAIEECPATEYTGIALEFGTLSFLDVLTALRARQWLANHPDAEAVQRERILRLARDAFYVDTPAWKAMAFAQTRVAALQALAALGSRSG
jgi:predicted deacylase